MAVSGMLLWRVPVFCGGGGNLQTGTGRRQFVACIFGHGLRVTAWA